MHLTTRPCDVTRDVTKQDQVGELKVQHRLVDFLVSKASLAAGGRAQGTIKHQIFEKNKLIFCLQGPFNIE